MLINSPNISGSLTVTGNATITGSLTVLGGINATITGSATSASYVEYSNVANKPTLVSGSAQVAAFGFATTGSNQFNGSQAITGSLTVTGQVIAQTLNVQQVTSSIVFSSGSNVFGSSLSNTQQLTGSVSVTGSLTVNNTPSILGSLTSGQVAFGTAANTVGGDSGLIWDNTNKRLGIGTTTPASILEVSQLLSPIFRISSNAVTIPNLTDIGTIEFYSNDASISARGVKSFVKSIAEAMGANQGSASLVFGTSANNEVNSTERWRITSLGIFQSNGAQTIQTSTGNLTLTSADNTGIVDIRRNDRALGAELRITNSFNGSGWLAGDVVGTLNFVSADGSTTEPIRSQIKAINTGGSNTYASEMNLTFSTAFFNTLTEGFRLTNLSNLLIGTTTDAGFRLDVNGTARVSGNLIANSSVGIGTTSLTQYSLRVSKNITGSVTSYGITSDGIIQSDSTSNGFYYSTLASTAAVSFTVGNIVHYFASQGTFGAGSSITNQYGFFAAASLIGATNDFGFYGDIAAGTNRWNLYMNGTAANYLAGQLLIGTTTTSAFSLDVNGTARVTGATASPTLTLANSTGGTLADFTITENTGLIVNSYEGASARSIDFRVAGTSALFVATSGNVGIGTISPGTPLDVFNNAAAGNNVAARFRTNFSGTDGQGVSIEFADITPTIFAKIMCTNQSSVTQRALAFLTYTSSNTLTEKLRIEGNGNVGIGTASPSSFSGYLNTTLQASGANGVNLDFRTSGGTREGVLLLASGTEFSLIAATAIPLTFRTNDTERLRINQYGQLLINATSSTYSTNLYGYNFGVRGNNNQTFISIARANQSLDSEGMIIGLDTTRASMFVFDNIPLAFATNSTERMRITSGGYLKASNDGAYIDSNPNTYHEILANTANSYTLIVSNKNASPASTYIQDWRFTASTPNNSSARFWNCEDATANRAYMRSDGGLSNYQANDTNLSDERTKKDIAPLESYWDKFKAIEIVKFKYKDQTHDDYNIGVIAQQVESVAPEFVDVDGWDNKAQSGQDGNANTNEQEPMKSIYTADLYHATIKVLQEAMAKIEEQQSQIEILKTKIEILEQS